MLFIYFFNRASENLGGGADRGTEYVVSTSITDS